MRALITSCAVLLLTAAWVPTGAAETVVLKNGRRLRGRVTVNGHRVVVRNRRGTLRLRRGLVADVKKKKERQTSGREKRDTQQRRPVLQRRVTVHFQGAALDEVIDRLRAATGAGFALGPGVEPDRLPPVTMHLQDATLKRVLDFLVQGAPRLAYRPTDGGNIRLGLRRRLRRRSVRIYDVRDRLYDRSDVRVRPQFGGARRGARGRAGRYGGGGGRPLRLRARSLAFLTARVVHPGSWNPRGIRVVGGRSGRGGRRRY